MLGGAFDGVGALQGDYYPAALRAEIDAVNERIYATVNNGVYRAGFATTQAAYEEAVGELFATLDWLEDRLARQRYLAASRVTEADWRLFTTLLRFDPVYHGHFKCNLRRLVDYPSLGLYARAVPDARRRRDGEHGPHQGPLLRQPQHQPDRHRTAGAGARLYEPAERGKDVARLLTF